MNKSLATSCLALSTVLAAQSVFAQADAPEFNTGVPLADVLLAQVGTPGLLSINATNGQQQIEVTIGPVPGEVRVQGVSGISSNTVFTGITSIRVRTGSFTDFVAFRSRSTVVPQIWVNTAGGDSDVIVDYEVPGTSAPVSTEVTVIGGGGNDKVAFLVDSRAASFTSSWNVDHRGGNNEAVASVQSPDASDLLSIDFSNITGAGKDKFETFIVHRAAAVDVSLDGLLGKNEDLASLGIDSVDPSNITVELALDLGDGKDSMNTNILSRGGATDIAGSVIGGQGLDTMGMTLESDGSVELTLDGGAGADFLDMFFKGVVTGNPRLLGGNSNDELKIVVDGPRVCTPFLDGGPGFDKAIGFGTIINCEDVN